MITITLTEQELQALSGLLDAGVRATGLRAVREATALLDKIEAAVADSRAPKSNGHSEQMEAH